MAGGALDGLKKIETALGILCESRVCYQQQGEGCGEQNWQNRESRQTICWHQYHRTQMDWQSLYFRRVWGLEQPALCIAARVGCTAPNVLSASLKWQPLLAGASK